MKYTITPIETRYKGYRFRSRLEARWAACFDATNYIKWDYELEGYELSEGLRYLPDFFIRPFMCHAEVKPVEIGVKDAEKIFRFVIDTRKSLLLLIGTPSHNPCTLLHYADPDARKNLDTACLERCDYKTKSKCGRRDFTENIVFPEEVIEECVYMFNGDAIKENRFFTNPCGGDEGSEIDNEQDPVAAARSMRF